MFYKTGVLFFLFSAFTLNSYSNVGNQAATAEHLEHDLKSDHTTQQKLYAKAIKDTEFHGFIKNPPYLVPIVPWNPELIWDKDKKRVLMASWMSEWAMKNFYQDKLHKTITTSDKLEYAPWVTSAGEMRTFVASFNSTDNLGLHERLNQRLGLPPREGQKYFVEFWVKPHDLFRPCLNPEIINNTCLADPSNIDSGEDYYKTFVTIPTPHYDWFVTRKKISYTGENPFPWSRLGTTFDWGLQSHVGFTEFVIRPNSTIEVESITPTDDYAQIKTP